MQTILDNATTSFATLTGATFPQLVTFMGTQIKLVLGSGLAVLQSLMPWIIALAVISAIVYFLYRAFRFFRH